MWLVKDNQPTLREEIALLFEPATPTVLGTMLPDDFVSYERRERRKLTASIELKG